MRSLPNAKHVSLKTSTTLWQMMEEAANIGFSHAAAPHMPRSQNTTRKGYNKTPDWLQVQFCSTIRFLKLLMNKTHNPHQNAIWGEFQPARLRLLFFYMHSQAKCIKNPILNDKIWPTFVLWNGGLLLVTFIFILSFSFSSEHHLTSS